MWAHGTYRTVPSSGFQSFWVYERTWKEAVSERVNERQVRARKSSRERRRKGENRFRFGLACYTIVWTPWCVGRFERIFLLCHLCILHEFLYTVEMVACMWVCVCALDMFRFLLFIFVYSLTTWFSPPLWFGPFTAFGWWWVQECVRRLAGVCAHHNSHYTYTTQLCVILLFFSSNIYFYVL